MVFMWELVIFLNGTNYRGAIHKLQDRNKGLWRPDAKIIDIFRIQIIVEIPQ